MCHMKYLLPKEIIWNNLVFEKVSLFAWKFFNNSLYFKDNLARHSILDQNCLFKGRELDENSNNLYTSIVNLEMC